MLKKILPVLVASLLFAGCAARFTNLSPHEQPRNANNLYPVEVQFDTRQQSIRWDSIEPYVVVGEHSYPMRKIEPLRNRWECLVPVPAATPSVEYRYKFDFYYNKFGGPQFDTLISPKFNLWISDR